MAIAQKTGTSVCEELPHLRSKKVINPQKKTKRPVAQIKVLKGNWTFMHSMYTATVFSCKHT
jgi:hypothetical protein